jgi:phosphoglucosamine mutase
MSIRKYFGTDGIRGRVGEATINPEFILKLGWAVGKVLIEKFGEAKVLVGKDTRISGYLLESVLEAGLSAAGVNAWMLGPMPTPAVAYLTRTFRAQIGIEISASHNPYYDNGIKFFSSEGIKLSDQFELAIEEQLPKPMQLVDAAKLGKAKRIDDAPGRYIEFCKSTLGIKNNLNGLKIVVDCANGATYQIAPAVLRELGASVVELGVDPDGFNINENCGSTYPQNLAKVVLAEKANLGIAFDGDGDRVIMVDNKGEIVDGDELLFIIAKHGFAKGVLHGGIVGTLMSNLGLEISLNNLGINFKRSKVGDRYVIEALRENNWLLGGESSGHIAHLGITTTGDGIVSALQVLNAICHSGKSLHELKSEMIKYPQVLINIKCDRPGNHINNSKIELAVKKVTKILGNRGRVLIRPSGTEPVIRVMAEGEDIELVSRSAEELAEIIKNCL